MSCNFFLKEIINTTYLNVVHSYKPKDALADNELLKRVLCVKFFTDDCLQVIFLFFKMPLDVIRNELSNSILSLQPEPEIPPELPPPRPHVRCCWLVTPYREKNRSRRVKKVSVLLCTTIIRQFLVALCYSSQSYTLTCKYANMWSYIGFSYNI